MLCSCSKVIWELLSTDKSLALSSYTERSDHFVYRPQGKGTVHPGDPSVSISQYFPYKMGGGGAIEGLSLQKGGGGGRQSFSQAEGGGGYNKFYGIFNTVA